MLFTKKKIIIIILISLVVIGVVYARNPKPLDVVKVDTEQTVVKKTVSGSGTVSSLMNANLSFPVSGRIVELYAKKGGLVDANTVLARVYSSDVYLAAQAKKDARDVSQRDLDLYIENYSTNWNAVGGEDEYNIGVRRLRELLSASEASYQATLAGLSNYYIQAPFAGTVLEVNGEVGEVAVASSTIVKLADLNNLIFEVELDQEDFGFVRIGQPVEIVLDSYPDDTLVGQVYEVPLFVDSTNSQNFLVKISIQKQDKLPILLGMDGDVDILIDSTENEVASLTFDRVFFDDDKKAFVWIVDDNKLKKQYIEVGLEGDVYTEIKSDISSQMVVSKDNDQELEEGMTVKVTE